MLRSAGRIIKGGFRLFSTRINFSTMEANQEIKYVDYTKDQYGDYPFIRSEFRSERKWIPVVEIDQNMAGSTVLVRARIHNSRSKGNNVFIELRENFSTVQACAFKSETISKEMIKYMASVPNESVVDVVGKVSVPDKPIQSCTQQVELHI